jgi:response regulator RpfG family c-di-GMP phosphodiesterase
MDKAIKIENSEYKNYSIVYLDADPTRSETYESLSEQDQDLYRINVFSSSNLSEAKNIVRKRNPDLAIFRSNFKDLDFIAICVELKSISRDLQLIPVVDSPSAFQLRELFGIKGISDFLSESMMKDYVDFKNVIQNFVRSSTITKSNDETLVDFDKLSIALSGGDIEKQEIKRLSKDILEEAISHFDLSLRDKLNVRAAEKVFFPNVSIATYSSLLSESDPEIYEILNLLFRFGGEPQDVGTFLVSFANFSSALIASGADREVFADLFRNPPKEVKHKSLRVISRHRVIERILEDRNENMRAG